MVTTVTFTTIPKARVDGGTFRFFPVVTGNPLPIVTYAWNFADGSVTPTSSAPSPMHVFSGASAYTFTVYLSVTDAAGTVSPVTPATSTVKIDLSASVAPVLVDGAYQSVSCFLYDSTNSMMVNRSSTTFCSMFLLNPVVRTSIDYSAACTFSLLVPASSTATERSLIVEGINAIVLQGNSIVFSGVIRRATQNVQGGFTTSLPIQMWDIECDSDLFKLTKLNVSSTVLQTNGLLIIDTPGNIVRKILTPATGGWDWRGDILCQDPVVEYQINPSTPVDQVPSQYEQLANVQSLTNYDLRARMEYDQLTCTAFNGTTVTTIGGASFVANGLTGYYLFFPNNQDGCQTYGKITSNDATNIFCSAMCVGASPATYPASGGTPDWVIIAKQPKIDFAPNLSTISNVETFNVNEDVFEYSDNDDKRKLYTKVVTKGKDDQGVNMSVAVAAVHAYDYDKQFYKDSTYLTYKTEGTIYKNGWLMYSGPPAIAGASPLAWNEMWLDGWDYALFAGSKINIVPPDHSSSELFTITDITQRLFENSKKYTKILITNAFDRFTADYSSGTLFSGRQYVNSISDIGCWYGPTYGATTVYTVIGEEVYPAIRHASKSATCGWYIEEFGGSSARGMTTTRKSYPHDVGALVARTIVDGVAVNETAPETGSVVADYGLHINTVTVETNTTYGKLDGYATALLLGFGSFYKKATCWMPLQHAKIKRVGGTPSTYTISPNITTAPRLGDMIGIVESGAATGATTDYQIVATTIKYDEGRIELQLGDYEKNVFTSLQKQTAGLNQTLT